MFENLSIGIKTFLRDPQFFNTIQAIRTSLPNAQLIIADCGEMTEEKDSLYAELEREGHVHIDLPFDSGFGVMSNAIADKLQRPLLLVGSDDFDFSPIEVRHGIEKLLHVAHFHPEFAVLSGRVNNWPYEFLLCDHGNGFIEEVNLGVVDLYADYHRVDLTVNYSLIRKEVFKKVRWDAPEPKIGGGEHFAFFWDCKQAGFAVAHVPGVNINEQQVRSTPRYNLYRRRAMDPARPCFVKRGIRKYVMGNGVVDYDAKY